MSTQFWLRAALSTAALTAATAPAIASPERACDCRDEDRDGLIDEGVDCLYAGNVEVTADDTYDLFLDGAHLGGDSAWNVATTYNFSVPAGTHRLAVEAQDVGYAVQGFLARVVPPFGASFVTGEGVWRLRNSAPAAGWQVVGGAGFAADDTAHCASTNAWGGQPQSLSDADWVWAGGCSPYSAPRQNYGIADFEVCGEATVCCDLKEGGVASLTAYECAEVGTQTGADQCAEVCCQIGDDRVETLMAGECDDIGGRVLEDAMCEEVCCDLRGEFVTAAAFTCRVHEGVQTEDRFCEESCDCEDNDRDGAIDERIDCTYDAGLRITADDTYEAYLDGVHIGGNANWSVASDYSFAVSAGRHVIAVEAADIGYSVQGLLARVFAPFGGSYDTGAGFWQLSNSAPAGNWKVTGAGLPVNDANAVCASANAWGGNPQSLSGADWVWAGSCSPYSAPRTLFAATTFEACVEATVCCETREGAVALPAAECAEVGAAVAAERCEEQPCVPVRCRLGERPADLDRDGCEEACVPDRAEAQPAQLSKVSFSGR